MNWVYLIVIILTIFLSIAAAYSLFRGMIHSWLKENCFMDSNCNIIRYYRINNSALIYVQNYGYVIWFNGINIFIYGESTGEQCNTGYEPAYEYMYPETGPRAYKCVESLENVRKFYENNTKLEELKYNPKNFNSFGVSDVLNLLQSAGVITLFNK